MRVVALVSGGKDSCYNMMKCVAAGHEIVALANLQPEQGLGDELDSYMFQTVGHEGVSLIAEAMGIPLYRTFTKGKSLTRELVYTPTNGDEVEELYELLVRVCEECGGVEGVSSGAILSDYQRLRVENVCSRVGLVSLSYLWRRNQEQLLREMIDNGIQAIVIKVASMGLYPDKHLGRTIEDLYSDLCELNRRYGVNVCGEGGEYETFTLDCPLYKKRINLLASEVVVTTSDPYAPVGYLKLTQLALVSKEHVPLSLTASTKMCLVSPPLPSLSLCGERQSQCVRDGCRVWLALEGDPCDSTIAVQSERLFEGACSRLRECGCEWRDAVLVYLYLSKMTDYPCVNSVYKRHFSSKPPARVCVSSSLPEGVLVRLEVVVWRCDSGRSSMHVQSHSEWAPANIGPYSQAYTVSDVVFGAGQIGLEPSSMTLTTPLSQATLSLTHVQSVLESCDAHLTSALCGMCYYTSDEAGWNARQSWWEVSRGLAISPDCPLLFLHVLDLPRGSCVEWHFVAVKTPSRVAYSCSKVSGDVMSGDVMGGDGDVTVRTAVDKDRKIGCWILTTNTEMFVPLDKVLKCCLSYLQTQLMKCQLSLSDLSYLRVCLPQYASSATCVQEISKLCSDCAGGVEIPLSVVTIQGYMGQNNQMFVQACKFC